MQITETELNKLIETVEQEFAVHLNKAEEAHAASLAKSEGSVSSTLAKAEDSAPPKKDKESKPEDKAPKAESKEDAPPKEGEAPAAPAAEGAPAEGEAPAAPAAEGQPAAAAPAAAAGAGHGYDDEDMAHMLKMYQSMSRDELLAHHDCVRQCLDAMGNEQAPAAPGAEAGPGMDKCGTMAMGKTEIKDENPTLNSKPKAGGENMNNDKKNGGIEGAPPHNTPGAKSAASNANGAKINKSEHDRRNGGKIEGQEPHNTPGAKSPASKAEGMQMSKSENTELELIKSELEAEKAKNADLKKSFDKATEVLTAMVKKVVPQGKAITSLDVVAKSEGGQESAELTKAQVTEILMKKDQTKLTKSDRDAINSFYLGGSDFNTISHLLKN
jgi:hypothetical protein